MYEDLVKKLRHRGTSYNGISLFNDAADAIEQVQNELESLQDCRHKCKIVCLLKEYTQMRDKYNHLKRERDQAVKDLRHKDVCDICIGSLNELEGCDCECLDCKLECRCRNCIDESLWQWRGVQEENNEQIDF